MLPDRGARLGGFSLLREQKPARVCAFPSHESRTVSEWRASREAGIPVRFECPNSDSLRVPLFFAPSLHSLCLGLSVEQTESE